MEHLSKDNASLKDVLKGFSKGVIAYYKIYAHITESVTAGLLLSQIAYWWYGPAGEKLFFKTNHDFVAELVMGDSEFKAAKKQLILLGFVETTLHGVPPKTYYIFKEAAVLESISNWSKTAQLNGRKSTSQLVENRPIERAKIDQSSGRKSTNQTGENRPPYKNTTDNTIEYNKDNKSVRSGLSGEEEKKEAYWLLRKYGVKENVAKNIIYEQLVPAESIREVIKNGLAKQKNETGFILRPGYIVEAINGARAEGKIVGPTKASRKLAEDIKKTTRQITIPRTSSPAEQEANRQKTLKQFELMKAGQL